MNRTFSTPEPVLLHLEIGAGDITVRSDDTMETTVEVTGRLADETRIEQDGRTISVIGPKQRGGLFFGSASLRVTATLPAGSDLSAVLGSADLRATGPVGGVTLRTGSGDVTLEQVGAAELTAGSGDVRIDGVADGLTAKSGSGNLTVGRLGGVSQTVSGSGDLTVQRFVGTLQAKSGSGDVTVHDASGELSTTTASGDTQVHLVRLGTTQVRSASGDITVGVLAGTPVWTDLNTVSGSVRSDLQSLGEPAEGQDYVELRTRTVSGDVVVRHVPGPTDRDEAPADRDAS